MTLTIPREMARDTERTPKANVPRHVAFIMDGNGRWARDRGLPRLAGHRAGVENIRAILRECADLGIEYVTMYAFSTENWTRPRAEVDGLMLLMGEFIDREARGLHAEGVRVRHLGTMEGIPERLQRKISWLINLTSQNTTLTTAVALNYGGRADLVEAVRSVVTTGLPPEAITEQVIASYLSTQDMPDPDLIIRTSGESRLSNFLIWQAAYSEYWTTPIHWPDFGPRALRQAIEEFAQRERRFGGIEPIRTAGDARLGADYRGDAPLRVFSSVPEAIADTAAGKLVLIVDDEERENEGDIAIAAQHVTPEVINFMASYARGLICMPIVGERLDELQIPMMVAREEGSMDTPFTVSVDALACSTGISAVDRAFTAQALIDPATKREDLIMPGHLFPLRYTEGGVLRRPGHTEASVDLARLAGCYPASVICEVMSEDGTMARRDELLAFAAQHDITTITVDALIAYCADLAAKGQLPNL
ncbi:MAG: undecaprenyl diphosphate synthase [Chloroflexota bacterium]|nr:undecaprenyl diphosphate synthase [Chloroflexota bacterium]